MKIENSSTVLSNIKVNTDKPTIKSTPPVPSKDSGAAGAQAAAGAKAPPVPEKQNSARIREAETEARKLKQERLEQESQQAIEEKVSSAIESIRGFIQENQRALDFDVAKESNRIIISVIDRNTNEVIRQIPPEEAIELADRIRQGDDITKSGLLVNGRA